jgi:hypothetical protein
MFLPKSVAAENDAAYALWVRTITVLDLLKPSLNVSGQDC